MSRDGSVEIVGACLETVNIQRRDQPAQKERGSTFGKNEVPRGTEGARIARFRSSRRGWTRNIVSVDDWREVCKTTTLTGQIQRGQDLPGGKRGRHHPRRQCPVDVRIETDKPKERERRKSLENRSSEGAK